MNMKSEEQKEYGKTIDFPVKLSGIDNNLMFLENLITVDGYHILFHRDGSMRHNGKVIDRYLILACDGRYEELYFDVYNEENVFIPPSGFLFESEVNFYHLDVDEKYFGRFDIPDDQNELAEYIKKLPFLERYISRSYGTNMKLRPFPDQLIKEMIEEGEIIGRGDVYKELMSHINQIKNPFQ